MTDLRFAPRSPARFARRRAGVLLAVHAAIALHVAHWLWAGRTLAPLELNEAMHTLELGLLTAGFVLFAAAFASVLLFGRYFCSWGCHLLALQDLSAWALGRLGLRPAPVRSRWLRWVAPAAAFYMFGWPHLARLAVRTWPPAAAWLGQRPPFRPRIEGAESTWASFWTSDFARNLPGPGIAVLTFLVCGFLLVRWLGTRSFCRDLCPYGALFSLADRFAPRRIVLAGDCTACGRCTAACDSGVSVFEQVRRWGAVRSGACLKDLDCVAVCPTGGLAYGRAPRPLLAAREQPRRPELSVAEEWAGAVAFVVTFAAARGLYRVVPFLLALALGALAAGGAVVALRLARRRDVVWQRWTFRRDGRSTRQGRFAAAGLALAALALVHSAVIRAAEVVGDADWQAWQAAGGGAAAPPPDRLVDLLELRARWGLARPADLPVRRVAARLARADGLAAAGRYEEALAELDLAVDADAAAAVPHYNAGVLLAHLGRQADAERAFRAALARDERDAESWNNLGYLLWRRGATAAAESALRRALALVPGYAQACANLAALLADSAREPEAAAVERDCVAAGVRR